MNLLTLNNVIDRLAQDVTAGFAQNLLPQHPHYGAYISAEHGLDEAGHVGTTRFLVQCGYLVLAHNRHIETLPVDALLRRMRLAVDYLLRVQRPSGLIDLRSTNYDSGPDTAFAVQLLCGFIDLARAEPVFAQILPGLETFMRRAVQGVMGGGFHTPNHRWVIAGALAAGGMLFPDLATQPVIDLYLAEGIDIDAEGAYLERSIGVYDAVTNRSLMLLAESGTNPEVRSNLLRAVRQNLEFNLNMFHADGTAETGLSTRQDYGQRFVATTLIAPYLQAGILLNDTRFISAAGYLWQQAGNQRIDDLEWQAYVLMKNGEPVRDLSALPVTYTRAYPHNRLWRYRNTDLSASVFGGKTHLLHLVYRSAELCSLKIAQAYFSVGLFIADEMVTDETGVLLASSGRQKPNLPAYHLPLGRHIAPEMFEATKQERSHRPVPPAESTLRITPADSGFDLHYRTLDGLDDVITQMSFDFPAGGMWETGDTLLPCQPGNIIFLKQGYGRMRFGSDVIEISPGANAHQAQAMRHSEPAAAGQVRVLLTFTTPVDHHVSIRVFQAFGDGT